MTNEQLYIAIGIPLVFNTVVISLMWYSLNKRLDDLKSEMDYRFENLKTYIDINFDSLCKLFTEKLKRVEDVWDARIKLMEEKNK